MKFGFQIFLIALAGCSYPIANPGEPEVAREQGRRGGAAVSPVGKPSNLINLSCNCDELLSPSLRAGYGEPSNTTIQSQTKCSYTDPTNDEESEQLTIEVARVISRTLFENIILKKKEQIPLVLKEVYSDEPIGDSEAKIVGTDSDQKIAVFAQFQASSGYVVVMSEFVSNEKEAPKSGASLRMIDIRDNISSACKE